MFPWRTVFFAINLAAALGWVVLATMFVAEEVFDSNLAAVIMWAAMGSPGFAVAIAEWRLFSRRSRSLERALGVLAGCVGALAVFAWISNVIDAAPRKSPSAAFWIVFSTTCLTIAVYGIWCCWLRVRHRTLPEEPGFPMPVETLRERSDHT